MAETRVINLKSCPASTRRADGVVFIGRPSKFGNPFKIGRDGDRAMVVAKYAVYANDKCEADPEFRAAVAGLHGKTLACYCAPLACHGDVLARLAAKYAEVKA